MHNLAQEPCRLTLPLDIADAAAYDDLLGGDGDELPEPCLPLTLEGYGCGWYRIHRRGQRVTP